MRGRVDDMARFDEIELIKEPTPDSPPPLRPLPPLEIATPEPAGRPVSHRAPGGPRPDPQTRARVPHRRLSASRARSRAHAPAPSEGDVRRDARPCMARDLGARRVPPAPLLVLLRRKLDPLGTNRRRDDLRHEDRLGGGLPPPRSAPRPAAGSGRASRSSRPASRSSSACSASGGRSRRGCRERGR